MTNSSTTASGNILKVLSLHNRNDLVTPAFVLEHDLLTKAASHIRAICDTACSSLLYSTKALCLPSAVRLIAHYVDGFSVCSSFEVQLIRNIVGSDASCHLTAPHICREDIESQLQPTDYIAFNSLSQLRANSGLFSDYPNFSLRVNPVCSFVSDIRYDPCRDHSKLGIPADLIAREWKELRRQDEQLTGLHFHNNCESHDMTNLLTTVRQLTQVCGDVLKDINWINLGGGYLFEKDDDLEPFYEAVGILTATYGLKVFIEPGAAFVRKAGYIVSEVVDMISRGGKWIAILDTTVNHMPEVFEFQYSPDVLGASDAGKYSYLLAGCSCLAGDLFGEYSFDEPLTVGSRVVFQNVGDYTTPKWHYFNGINLPSIYSLNENDELTLIKQFTYEDFASRYGVESNVVV